VHRFDATNLRGQTVSTYQRDPAELGIHTWLDRFAEEGISPRLRQMFVLSRIDHKTPDMEDVLMYPSLRVVACEYSGRDIRHRVRIRRADEPIRFLEELEPLDELSWSDMVPAATAIDRVIGQDARGGGDGGALMAGMTHGGLQTALWFDSVEVNIERLLEDILTDAAQSYFSVWRQHAEWWSQPHRNDVANGQIGHITGLALRLGGGGWFWVGVMAALTALPLVALSRLARPARWDPDREYPLSEISSDDGLSGDEDQVMFTMQGVPKCEYPPAYSEKSVDLL